MTSPVTVEPNESGAAVTDAADAFPCPGTTAWTAKALDVVAEALTDCDAPAAPTSSAAASATRTRRATPALLAIAPDECGALRRRAVGAHAGHLDRVPGHREAVGSAEPLEPRL